MRSTFGALLITSRLLHASATELDITGHSA